MNSYNLVSVVIPFYNSEKYLLNTLISVYNQTYKNIEVILINDGSEDDSDRIARTFIRANDKYIIKENTGISDSRNLGIKASEGTYILFLDSDDILSNDFIEKRVNLLDKNPDLSFCCSNIIKIDLNGNKINGFYRGIYQNVNEEVLLYSTIGLTCPSNYLIRKNVLIENRILFNTKLSSSADRFFLIELSKYSKGGYIHEGGELFYRVHPNSMSHNLNEKLIKDNLIYLNELKKSEYIPKALKRKFYFKINYILAGSNFKLRNYGNFTFHVIQAFFYKPILFLKVITRK